jgi:hypothetical protein
MPYIPDHGPFYHGTKAHLQIGDVLTAGFQSNYRPQSGFKRSKVVFKKELFSKPKFLKDFGFFVFKTIR